MSKYSVNLRTLKALAKHVAPKVESRRYLIGVQLEFAPDGVYYVAADGGMLAAMREPYDASETAPVNPFELIVPRRLALDFRLNKHTHMGYLDTEASPHVLGGVQFDPVEGLFPKWRNVLPVYGVEEQMAQYDSKRLAAFEACAADIAATDGAAGYFWQNGGKPGVFACYRLPEFLGVLMCRHCPENGPCGAPAWSGITTPQIGDKVPA